MQEPKPDIHGKNFYGWSVYVEGKTKFGANTPEDIFAIIEEHMEEGREVIIKPEHWGGRL
ncbi:hypothetical protein SEA_MULCHMANSION_183 [Streptomyces phage MulchMansion]|nr:hypothetical protein SEA_MULCHMANSION_183 [Streptomyces phage MulchMansion]